MVKSKALENKLGIWAFGIEKSSNLGWKHISRAFIVAELKNSLNFKLMSGQFELTLMWKHIRQAFTVVELKNSMNFELEWPFWTQLNEEHIKPIFIVAKLKNYLNLKLIIFHFELKLMSSKLPCPFRTHLAQFEFVFYSLKTGPLFFYFPLNFLLYKAFDLPRASRVVFHWLGAFNDE